MEKLLLSNTRVEIGTAAIFFNKKQTEAGITKFASESNTKATNRPIDNQKCREALYNQSLFYVSYSFSNSSQSFFRITKAKNFLSPIEISDKVLSEDTEGARFRTKIKKL